MGQIEERARWVGVGQLGTWGLGLRSTARARWVSVGRRRGVGEFRLVRSGRRKKKKEREKDDESAMVSFGGGGERMMNRWQR